MTAALRTQDRTESEARRTRPWLRRSTDTRHVAVDLGSSTIRVGTASGIVVDEPSAVMVRSDGGIFAVGQRARALIGRNPPAVELVEPIRGALIRDADVAEAMLRMLLSRGIANPRSVKTAVVAVPLVATGLERRAVLQVADRVFPRATIVPIEAPMAAAIGAGVPVQAPAGTMVLDVGRGATEAAVMSHGTMISMWSAPVGGELAEAEMIAHVLEEHDLAIGQLMAERVVRLSTHALRGPIEVRGVDRVSGLPTAIRISSAEAQIILRPVVQEIADVAKAALDLAPPSLAADVMRGTIMLTGGASKLDGLAAAVTRTTGIDVQTREWPDRAVIDGASSCINEPALTRSAYR